MIEQEIKERQLPAGGVILRGSLHIEARDADGNITGEWCDDDLTTKQLAQLIMANILDTAPGSSAMTDTSGSTHTVTVNSAATLPLIAAGTSGTTATVADHALGTQTETVTAVTSTTFTGSGSSGTVMVTGTITAGSARAYQEVGIEVTVGSNIYLLTHDTFTTLNVSSGGTLAVTYMFTFS
jgi:creatinine amidohydrolase/Fe(II)-dependent formamide hydrolase-like protein